MAPSYGNLNFREQILFFAKKVNVPTAAWTDLWQADHDTGFMVAGAAKAELLQDLRDAVNKAIAEGGTLEEFRRDFDDIVKRHGWAYNGGRNWRTRIIYETNLRTSYAAGRYAQLKANTTAFPFWQYKHSHLDKVPRPLHVTKYPAGWNGLVLKHDDPWWRTHFPPNGWGCTCYVVGVSNGKLKRMGKSGPDQAPETKWTTEIVGGRGPSPRPARVAEGVDPGFAYAPGASNHAQVQQYVADLIQHELDADFATALTRYLAVIPKAPKPPVIPDAGTGSSSNRPGGG